MNVLCEYHLGTNIVHCADRIDNWFDESICIIALNQNVNEVQKKNLNSAQFFVTLFM
jgi:hypothetical protein